MSDKEVFSLSRRRLLQLPTARGIGNLKGLANAGRFAEFVAQNPDKTLAVTQRFLETVKGIFQSTFKPETPEVFKNRPEEVELSVRDKAINAVTDILQPHAETLRRMNLDPLAAIEPIADYLVTASSTGIYLGSILLANPTRFHIYQLIEDGFTGSAHYMNRGSYQNPNTPERLYAKESRDLFRSDMKLWDKGPFSTHCLYKSHYEKTTKGQLVDLRAQGVGQGKAYYIGELLPVR